MKLAVLCCFLFLAAATATTTTHAASLSPAAAAEAMESLASQPGIAPATVSRQGRQLPRSFDPTKQRPKHPRLPPRRG